MCKLEQYSKINALKLNDVHLPEQVVPIIKEFYMCLSV